MLGYKVGDRVIVKHEEIYSFSNPGDMATVLVVRKNGDLGIVSPIWPDGGRCGWTFRPDQVILAPIKNRCAGCDQTIYGQTVCEGCSAYDEHTSVY